VEAGARSVGQVAPGSVDLGATSRRLGERAIRVALFLATAVSVLTTLGILVALLRETIAFFSEIGVGRFFTDGEWAPLFEPAQYGIWQLINGTLLVTGVAILVAIPLGLGSAIYLSEYASPRVRKVIKPVLEVLVGVPTIIFGYFALTLVTPDILQGLLGVDVQIFNVLAASLVMAIMILPTIASVSEDSMRAVPGSLREGAFGMGATKLQVSTRVVFPAALSGIVAACVLGISRAIGETMIVLIAAGQKPCSGIDPRQPCETISAFIAATGKGDVPTGSIEYKTIFAAGTMLFVLTLVFNIIAIRFVRKYRQVYD
jgi:phosphate transport system permease protein